MKMTFGWPRYSIIVQRLAAHHKRHVAAAATGRNICGQQQQQHCVVGRRSSWRRCCRRYHGSDQETASSSSSLINTILRDVQKGTVTPDEATKRIDQLQQQQQQGKAGSSNQQTEPFANLDHDRAQRTGFPEVVFAEGKTSSEIARILDEMARHVNERISMEDGTNSNAHASANAILATRVSPEQFDEVSQIPLKHGTIKYHRKARVISMTASSVMASSSRPSPLAVSNKRIVVATAGTTDIPVAEEAGVVLEAAGCNVERVYDAGVAGLHRIVSAIPRLRSPDVAAIIVCAGMDGALPSVVGGLVNVPVIAVPTSVGYGASLSGIGALLTMLNSCSPGVAVVNIDNGFGAAAFAFKCVRVHATPSSSAESQ